VVQREHALETRGLYGAVRHPGYLGAWLAALGSLTAFSSALAMPLLVAFAWLLAQRAHKEEALLERHFGDAYRAYCARTGAFLPRFRS
jgi:protein-S-isoprenylcysteine O-methyltransferase Ste14